MVVYIGPPNLVFEMCLLRTSVSVGWVSIHFVDIKQKPGVFICMLIATSWERGKMQEKKLSLQSRKGKQKKWVALF